MIALSLPSPAQVALIACCGLLTAVGSAAADSLQPTPSGSAHHAIVGSLGLYADESIDSLLQEVGKRVAAESREPDRPWTFWLVDDPALNLFSSPPAAVYLTRGLFLHLDSEAELAAILAHGIAHLEAGHQQREMEAAELHSFGLGLPWLVKDELRDFSPLAIAGLERLLGSYRASEDRRADDLAFRMLERAGYELGAPAGIYALLDQTEGLDSNPRLPGWWQTHPGPENRSKRAAKEAATFPAGHRSGDQGRSRLVSLLDGIVFGSNLERPYFDDHKYFHPTARFQLSLPGNWKRTQVGESVLAVSPEGDAVIRISPTAESDNVAALRAFFEPSELVAKRSWRRSVNNFSAVWATFDVRREERDLEGRVGFVVIDDTVYRLLGYGLERLWMRHFSAVQKSLEGIRRIKPPEGGESLDSARIELLEMEEERSLSQLEEDFPSATSRRQVRALNRLFDGRRTAIGELFRHVVGGLDAVVEEVDDESSGEASEEAESDAEGDSPDDRGPADHGEPPETAVPSEASGAGTESAQSSGEGA